MVSVETNPDWFIRCGCPIPRSSPGSTSEHLRRRRIRKGRGGGRCSAEPFRGRPRRYARPFRTVDLFCGCGGFALGVKHLCSEFGFPMVAELIVDEDEEAIAVYASNHETRIRRTASVASLVDFRFRGRAGGASVVYEPEIVDPRLATAVHGVDLVMAGPPCQGHSNLNNQTRRDDVRAACTTRLAKTHRWRCGSERRFLSTTCASKWTEPFRVSHGLVQTSSFPKSVSPYSSTVASGTHVRIMERPLLPIENGGWRSSRRTWSVIVGTTRNSRLPAGWH